MTTPPLLTLKKFLAERLKEEIEMFSHGTPDNIYFFWKESPMGGTSNMRLIRDTEWEGIQRRVERKLSHDEKQALAYYLREEFGDHGAIYLEWPLRTQAMMELFASPNKE